MKRIAWRATALGVSLTLCVGIGASVLMARSSGHELTAAETVAAITQVDPANRSTVSVTRTSAGDLTTDVGGHSVTIPADPANGVTLGESGTPITIGLPGAAHADDARLVGDTAVYENAAPSADVAVQALAGGSVRQLITLAGPASPRTFDFPLDLPAGATLRPSGDGGAEVVRKEEILAVVDAPWARDARGRALPTYYTIVGSTLSQHIDLDGQTAFPVMADPLWLPGWVLYIVGSRCGVGAAGALLAYRLATEHRSWTGYFSQSVIGCLAGGLGIRRY